MGNPLIQDGEIHVNTPLRKIVAIALIVAASGTLLYPMVAQRILM